MSDPKVIEAIARAICKARGRSPDMCVMGSGQMSESGGHSECYRFAWEDEIGAAHAAYEAAKGEAHADSKRQIADLIEAEREFGDFADRLAGIVAGAETSEMTFGEATRAIPAQVEPVGWLWDLKAAGITEPAFYPRPPSDEEAKRYPASPLYTQPAPASGLDPATVQACIDAQPSTAADPNESTYLRGRFDGVMSYSAALRALLKGGANG